MKSTRFRERVGFLRMIFLTFPGLSTESGFSSNIFSVEERNFRALEARHNRIESKSNFQKRDLRRVGLIKPSLISLR